MQKKGNPTLYFHRTTSNVLFRGNDRTKPDGAKVSWMEAGATNHGQLLLLLPSYTAGEYGQALKNTYLDRPLFSKEISKQSHVYI